MIAAPQVAKSFLSRVTIAKSYSMAVAAIRPSAVVMWDKAIPLVREGLTFEEGFGVDLMVDDCGRIVIVEVKAVSEIMAIHRMQVQTYLLLSTKPLGLFIHFSVPLIKQGITWVVNGLEGLKQKD